MSGSDSDEKAKRPAPPMKFVRQMTTHLVPENATAKDILRDVHSLYTNGPFALEGIAHELGKWLKQANKYQDNFQLPDELHIKAPRECITVLIVGTHSAGKSSFINWYTGETVQKENMAAETAGFAVVTSGSQRDRWGTDLTLRMMPHLSGVQQFAGMLDGGLVTEVSASRKRKFPLVDFIDSPGLTDSADYPFDIEAVIQWLAEHVELVFMFFDPHGTADGKRTQRVAKALVNIPNARERVHWFLTRCDEIKTENERRDVVTQLTLGLSKATEGTQQFYGSHAKINAIYRPSEPLDRLSEEERAAIEEKEALEPDGIQPVEDYNKIHEACQLITESINKNVQRHVNSLEKDCKQIKSYVERELHAHARDERHNNRCNALRRLLLSISWLFPLLFTMYLLRFALLLVSASDSSLSAMFDFVRLFNPVVQTMQQGGDIYRFPMISFFVFLVLHVLVMIANLFRRELRPADRLELLRKWSAHMDTLLDEKEGKVCKLWNQYTSFSKGDADDAFDKD